jgi:hypothetical protein
VFSLPVLKKLQMLEKIEEKRKKYRWNHDKYFANLGSGELMVLFGLFPHPTKCRDKEQMILLKSVLEAFVLPDGTNQSIVKRVYFGNEECEYDLVYWLYVLFNAYENTEAKKELLGIFVKLHSDLPKMLPLLVSFVRPGSGPLSKKDEAGNECRMNMLISLADKNENKHLFIQENVTSCLLPFLRDNKYNCCRLLSSLSSVEDFTLKTRIIQTPNFVSTVTANLLHNTRDEKALHYCDVSSALRAVCSCCAVVNHSNFWERVERVNETALQVCATHQLPATLLGLVIELVRKATIDSLEVFLKIESLAGKLLFLYPTGGRGLKADAVMQKEVGSTFAFMLEMMMVVKRRRVKSYLFNPLSSVLYDLAYVCGEFDINGVQGLVNLRKVVSLVNYLEGGYGYDGVIRVLMHMLPGLRRSVAEPEGVVACLEKAKRVNEENSRSYWKEEQNYVGFASWGRVYEYEKVFVPENEALKAKAEEIGKALESLKW